MDGSAIGDKDLVSKLEDGLVGVLIKLLTCYGTFDGRAHLGLPKAVYHVGAMASIEGFGTRTNNVDQFLS